MSKRTADGVDSNYEGWSAGGEVHLNLRRPGRCPTWGGEEE